MWLRRVASLPPSGQKICEHASSEEKQIDKRQPSFMYLSTKSQLFCYLSERSEEFEPRRSFPLAP